MSGILIADSIEFAYEPGRPILESWSAEFDSGEVVAVTGPSGRGKSTLLYILGLMLRPSRGQVLLDGRSVERGSDRARAALRASEFGFVFQDSALDTGRTVLDNILESALYRGTSRRAAQQRATQLMDELGVALRANAKPGQVSGGQAQRIAMCRALLGDPRIILADEPTGNLDPVSSRLVFTKLQEHARQGGAVIVVTHDPAVVGRCDREVRL